MIYVVHGEDLTKSRILIQNQQKKIGAESRIEVDLSEISPDIMYEKSCSKDLFGNPPFIVLDITSAGRTNLEPYIEMLQKIPETTTFIILSGKTLPKTNLFLKNAGKLKIKLNLSEVVPQSNTFAFVDALFYKQREKAYSELSKLIKDQVSPYEIMSLIHYGLRSMASSKFDSPSHKKAHPFVKKKTISQSQKFTTEQIKYLFEEFRKIDKKSKLGEVDEDILLPLVIETVLHS